MSPDVAPAEVPPRRRPARTFMRYALGIIPVNVVLWIAILSFGRQAVMPGLAAFTLLTMAQFGCGVAALVTGIQERRATHGASGLGPAIVGSVVAVGAPVGWAFGAIVASAASLRW